MELDDHISKYIDGELNEEEDVLLRKLLSEDDFAKEKFDSAVNVHLAMKEDCDSIEPPEDILRQTEDIVLMKILASQPFVVERPFFWRRSQVLAAMIVFFIFSFVFQIDDMTLGGFGKNFGITNSELNSEKNETSGTQNFSENNIVSSSGRIINSRGTSLRGRGTVSEPAISSITSAGGGGESSSVDVQPTPDLSAIMDETASEDKGDVMAKPPSPALNSKDVNGPIGQVSNPSVAVIRNEQEEEKKDDLKKSGKYEYEKTNNILAIKTKLVSNVNFSVPVKPGETKTEVIFSSFLGTDFVRTGFGEGEKLAVTNFSQSIAYSINSDEKMGIEIGFSEYAYKENVVLPSPYNPLVTKGTTMVETSDLVMPVSPNLYEYKMTIENQRQMVWGSAFYERSIIRSEDLSLEGRVGLGMSHDGPLGYGRLFGMYEFLDGVSVTVGTEGRLFNASLPGESLSKRLKSTATVIYGFQINF